MKEIVNKLHENRQIQLAKSILEDAGYTVEKQTLVESLEWEEDGRGNFICDLGNNITGAVGPERDGTWWVEIENEDTARVVGRNRNPLATKEEAMSWIEKWAAKKSKTTKPRGIPQKVKDASINLAYFYDNGYSDEEITYNKEEFEEMADILGVSPESLYVIGDDDDDDSFDYFRDLIEVSTKVENKVLHPGSVVSVYKAPEGFKFLGKTEDGYESIYFTIPETKTT